MSNCIFCKIVNGEIPAVKVFENEHVLAFLDISQTTEGHTLVIPKQHVENLFMLDQETAQQVFSVIPSIANAIVRAFDAKGLNLVNNNHEVAGQTVFHYHVHLVPRYEGHDDGFRILYSNNMEKYSQQRLQELALQIKAHLT